MSRAGLIWDACTLLNLAASGRIEVILASIGCKNFVVKEVRVEEVLYLRPLPEEDPRGELVSFDLLPLLEAGLLEDCELTADEQETFVRFAGRIDDGEAKTAAVALHRGYRVATDDRSALRLLGALTPPISTWTTLQWLKRWADQEQVGSEEMRAVLRNIRIRSNYRPRNRDPLYDWWESHFLPET